MYDGDSFYTLSVMARIGLVLVSLGLSGGVAWVIWRLTSQRGWIVRTGIWGLAYYLFIWLSPQGYYTYYRQIIDGLPRQWVVGAPTSIWDALAVLTFTGPQTLSAHSLGALGWATLILALWPQRSKCRDAAD